MGQFLDADFIIHVNFAKQKYFGKHNGAYYCILGILLFSKKCYYEGNTVHYQKISIDACKGLWVSAIFTERNSSRNLLKVMSFC